MCEKPFLVKPKPDKYPKAKLGDFTLANCGKCTECRIKGAKEWAHRIELEIKSYKGVCAFVTLTFDEENYVAPNLDKRDVQLFLKRLRKSVPDRKIKYYAVGEYGPKHLRKHYHLIIMGLDGKDHYGNNDRQKRLEPIVGADTDWHKIHNAWNKGITNTQTPRGGCASYVAGYVVKTAKRADEIERLGLEPEFRLMSKALGATEVKRLANLIKKKGYDPDIPINYFEYNGKYKKPLGRYLRQVFHETLGKLKELKMANKIYNLNQIKKWSVKGIEFIPEVYLRLTEYERCAKYTKYKLKMGLI